jgi:hypothetical protein
MVEVIVQQVDCFSHAEKIGFVGSGIGASQPTGCTDDDYDWLRLTDGVRITLPGEGGVKLIVFFMGYQKQSKTIN